MFTPVLAIGFLQAGQDNISAPLDSSRGCRYIVLDPKGYHSGGLYQERLNAARAAAGLQPTEIDNVFRESDRKMKGLREPSIPYGACKLLPKQLNDTPCDDRLFFLARALYD